MKNKIENKHGFELLAYTVFAAISVAIVFYLFYYDPVNYTRLITEDNLGEYGTSVSYALTGILLLLLSLKHGPKVRRVIWLLIGIAALVIAGEEISWGQRIISIGQLNVINQYNIQGETTLHNLVVFDSVNKQLHVIASYLILVYMGFSIMVTTLLPRLEEKFTTIGLPLIHLRLIPLFLLAPYFFLFYPVAKAEEFGELFLGLAALIWAIDLFLVSNERKKYDGFSLTLIVTAVLISVAVASAVLTHWYSFGFNKRLNSMASIDYPGLKMYEQAERLYEFIYEHPQYMTSNTRINHAKLLQTTGRQADAEQILLLEIREIKTAEPLKNSDSNKSRQLGIIYALLSANTMADNYFDQSIEIDRQKLAQAVANGEKMGVLWSISKTEEARGNIEAAIKVLKQAIEYAPSPRLRFKLEQKLKVLE